ELARIRFITSHPRDLNQKLMLAMAESAKVCEHLHLPVQSGSNQVLRRMYRGYTAEQYRQNISHLRQLVPGIAITTDFIVGFPGESEEDFTATMELLQAVQFENSFSFIYSPRPFTKAATWDEQIPLTTAKARLSRLQQLQNQITAEHLQNYL